MVVVEEKKEEEEDVEEEEEEEEDDDVEMLHYIDFIRCSLQYSTICT